ncbi:MAG: hypothetical protein COW73_07110 [Nitrospirae bacterium CG18_big_fil_WC_8_21_14_2_50_70_55]|nr:hypothetical protein [Deltaproteobacteria bacterium]OIP64049.1 MAG: hypothetical protein AUK30_07345 [Nitrospirae bacterium CG2_30_70_394]PIQ04828.1 MAG: hypothetical protein COW73_07110 [Nitrospirae bacterium CG18_big_fil_WC_8_21_14_2_50_70_55]PIU77530.1 MAG: hypothetical protein COS73_10155 [Nitrospirae bacterium CG06_land_8_20_14_3_00_70_43]PIW84069.1 MAG: hypothetical protein COZ96_00030 [Nitrospirae bacterium CG_4_8_14_3_um_filter_70_85]PIX83690.1 MAG: hypothetical protein COZ33_04115 
MCAMSLIDRVASVFLADCRRLARDGELLREFDLAGPLLLSEVCLARALINRLGAGETAVFRSRWEETHRDLIHLCNVLGHEYVDAEFDGVDYFITIRIRGEAERLPRRDAFSLPHPAPRRVITLDLTREPAAEPLLPGGRTLLP